MKDDLRPLIPDPRSLTPDRSPIQTRLILVTVSAFVYLGLPEFGDETGRPPAHFTKLAEAFLEGRLTIEASPAAGWQVAELIPVGAFPAAGVQSFYCVYPPLPAVLLLPFVAVFAGAVKVETACRIASVVNVILFDACLQRLPDHLGLPRLTVGARSALTLLFAFGTVCWHNAEFGGDWHLAHAVALGAMLLGLREFLAGNRPFVVGCFVALAILTRPTAALAGLFFAMPLVRARATPRLVRLAAVPALAVFLLAAYNHARFGSPTEFGYDRMLLRDDGLAMMARYGQFHPHFVARNAFWFFLAPPWPLVDGRFPFLGFDARGLSLFCASPALLYAFAAFRRRPGGDKDHLCPTVRDALVGVVACLVPLLLYFNTGYAQFGHRFSMDYLPLLMVLVVAGMRGRPSRLAHALIVLSIGVQAIGVLLDPVTRLPVTW